VFYKTVLSVVAGLDLLLLTFFYTSSHAFAKRKTTVMYDGDLEVKTTIRLPKSVLRNLKFLSIDEDITLAQLITKILKEYSARRESKK
jgi:predicted DNA-binding ribbon-helix-helix protein